MRRLITFILKLIRRPFCKHRCFIIPEELFGLIVDPGKKYDIKCKHCTFKVSLSYVDAQLFIIGAQSNANV